MATALSTQPFTHHVYPELREHFDKLATSQNPSTLFITCSDSRVDPSLITQTLPGELFILRNVGNLVPTYGEDDDSAAVVEYAVAVLGVARIVVCGHSNCGAMNGLLNPDTVTGVPAVARWLEHATPVRDAVAHVHTSERWDAAVHANVRHQLNQLLTHPSVAEAHAAGKLELDGWVYDIGAGAIDTLTLQQQAVRA